MLSVWSVTLTHVHALAQHPKGHDVASHVTHCPVWHIWLKHAAHASPPVPHPLKSCCPYGMHTFPSQHPFGHVSASQNPHDPFTHVPPPQSWHALPAVPQ